MMGNILGIELRFRPGASDARWLGALEALLAHEQRLRPSLVDRLSDADAQGPEPWHDALLPELARRCAGDELSSWSLLRADDPAVGVTVARWQAEVAVSIALPEPSRPVPEYVAGLIEALAGTVAPALGMAFDRATADAEFVMQGLRGLRDVPPLLYLDARSAARTGGVAHAREAPCSVIELNRGSSGLILVVRVLPWGEPAAAARADIERVRRFLGVTATTPLILAEP